MTVKNGYFEGLDEIRAIASLGVLVHHVELYKNRLGFSSLYDTPLKYFTQSLGHKGVHLFFCLSGFLITTLLWREFQKTSTIDIKNFYLKRVLRIWPLYYLMLLIAFIVLPKIMTLPNSQHENVKAMWLYSTFLSNYAGKNRIFVPGASHTWSISLEEQFYLFWPVILLGFRCNFLVSSVMLIATSIIAYAFLPPNISEPLNFLIQVVYDLRFMALGCFASVFYVMKEDWVNNMLSIPVIRIFLAIGFCLCFSMPLNSYLYGSLFVLFMISNTLQSKIKIRNRFLAELGKVSYGIYMFHPVVMFAVFYLFPIDKGWGNFTIYFSTVTLTLLVSFLSHYTLERFFLNLKDNFGLRKFT